MFHKALIQDRRAVHPGRLICILVLAFAAGPGYAQKTDVVYLTNGDRITGDVKRLERGRLLVKTRSLGSIYLEWAAVAQVVSDKPLRLELADGRRVLGSLHRAFGSQISVATVFGETEELLVESVVRMDPVYMDRGFWHWLDGKIGLGFCYAKGSEVGQLYFLGNAKYREVDSEYELTWNSILTSNQSGADTKRGNIGGSDRNYLENHWFWTGLANIDRNDELGIDSRFSAGGGGG
ncbi:MAG: hypothetical protein O7F73_16970 [Gammaproteobacteria bacterium]|nr:hypothetical protein [Gammaproteobacteria bacterium]